MESKNHWVEGPRNQWIFCADDNTSLEGLTEKININEVYCTDDSVLTNLGVRKINGRIYAGNYVGVCRLKSVTGSTIKTNDGREVILKIQPRFSLSAVEMLNIIKEDEEFERYLAPQTTRIGTADREVEDLINNELFHFFSDEDPIFLQDEIAKESSIITASVFISLLYNLCKRPLMGKTIRREENLIGKAKGKILFNQNIRFNTLKGRDDRLYCRYLQYTEDIIENQILKAALRKVELFISQYFHSVSAYRNTFREMLSYCNNALAHISNKKISRYDLNGIKTSGVYVYYKPVINAAKIVLNEITMAANGSSTITSYVIPYAISMEKLFEMYIRSYFKRAGVNVYGAKEPGIQLIPFDDKTMVLKERNKLLANYINGALKPDIILFNPETTRYAIFDVKYKASTNTRFSRSDRMQILAYGLMFNAENIGNIFPTQEETGNIFYRSNEINSNESMIRRYHQLEIAIDKECSEPLKKSL